jgi:HSP20 family protein
VISRMNDPKALWNAIKGQANKTLGEDFWHDISRLIPNPGPRVDIFETSGEVVVVVELPGLSSLDAIKLSLVDRQLMMKGEIRCDYPVEEEELSLSERFYGKFQRSIPLPHDVEADGVATNYRLGLLTVRFRKKAMEGVRPIQLNPDAGE